jgi:alkylation response protein AidB-like acyl-CoA dehydrogenase
VDLRASDEQQQLRDTLRRLFDRRLTELVDALPSPPTHDAAVALEDGLAVGLPALGLPEAHGGLGTFGDLVVAHEEMGRGLTGPLLPALSAAGRLLLRTRGDDSTRLLTELAGGSRTATPALDDGAEATTVADVDGQVVVEGSKRRVVAGRDVADVLVTARDPATGATTVAVVPTDAPGVEWHEEPGSCDIASWTVRFTAVSLPAHHRLEVVDGGLEAYLAEVSLLAAARQLGGGRAVLDRTISHVRTREQFDRAIGTFQAVQHQLADVATDLDATELAVAQGAWAVDAALAPVETHRLAAIAALTAAASLRRATLVAHQLHGGMGFVLDSPLHLWSARAVADPTVPLARRQLLDDLCAASGITEDAITVPPDHRLAAR